MTAIDELLKSDEHNAGESLKILAQIAPDTLPTVDEATAFLQAVGNEFSRVSRYDDYSRDLNTWLSEQKGNAEQNVEFLRTATLIGTAPEEQDPVAQARDALFRATSVVSRSLLLLRIRRDYLLGILELLRLRLTPAFGYLRLQTETTALLALMAAEPRIADTWMAAHSEEEGRAFFRAHQPRVVQRLKDLKLYDAYDQGSHIAQYSRVLGMTPGLVLGRKSGKSGDATLSYQEIDDPGRLFLWLCSYLRTHVQIFQALGTGFPEIDFKKCSPDDFSRRVQSLGARLQQLAVNLEGEGVG